MFCTKCGQEIKDGAMFCTSCGAAIGIKAVSPNNNQRSIPENSASGSKKGYGAIIAIIVILIILIIGVSGAAFWFMGGKDMIYDIIGIPTSDIIDDIDDLDFEDDLDREQDLDAAEDSDAEEEKVTPVEVDDNKAADKELQTKAAEEVGQENEKAEEIEEPEEEPSEYIIEDSDKMYLTKEDLEGFTAEQCRLARNELYARHGRRFDDEELQSYFESLSWYLGTIDAKDFQESMLSDIEMANRDLIVEYEKEMGYR